MIPLNKKFEYSNLQIKVRIDIFENINITVTDQTDVKNNVYHTF